MFQINQEHRLSCTLKTQLRVCLQRLWPSQVQIYYTGCAASGYVRLRGRINLELFNNICHGLWCVISVRGKEGDRDLVYYSATTRYYAITMHFKRKIIVFSSSLVLHTLSINKLEMIQRKAVRFVCNDYDRHAIVTNMLNDLGWDTLEHRRKAARLVQTKLIQMGDSAIPKTLTPLATDRSRRSRTGNSQWLHQTYCRTDTYRHSFLPWTWEIRTNSLTASLIALPIDNFKSQVLDHIRHTSPWPRIPLP